MLFMNYVLESENWLIYSLNQFGLFWQSDLNLTNAMICDSLNHIVAIIGVSIDFLGSMLGSQSDVW